jgi:hypothetical protein
MKYKMLVKAKNSGRIDARTINVGNFEKMKLSRQFNSLMTVTFFDTHKDITRMITNVVEIERVEP